MNPLLLAAVMFGAGAMSPLRRQGWAPKQLVDMPKPQPMPTPARKSGPLTEDQIKAMAEHEARCIKGMKNKRRRRNGGGQ